MAAAFAVAGALYLVAHRVWYGGWTVYATGDHFADTGEFSVVGTKVDLVGPVPAAGRPARRPGLRDRRLVAGVVPGAVRPRPPGRRAGGRAAGWSLAAIAAGWLNATFVALTMHGYWVPGRQIVVVLPLAALGLALVADRGRALADGDRRARGWSAP